MLKQTELNGSIKTNNMKNNGIADFIKPTIITGQQYGTKVSVELDHSDTDIDELMYAFQTLIVGLGYSDTSFKSWVLDRADEYRETDTDNLKKALNDWKFEEDDSTELTHRYNEDLIAERRMDIIGQNGNEGLHYSNDGGFDGNPKKKTKKK